MLTHARMRDLIAKSSGLPSHVVAYVLDEQEKLIQRELEQQGEVVFRGLFRVVPSRRTYRRRTELGPVVTTIEKIILTVRPLRDLRLRLNAVLTPR